MLGILYESYIHPITILSTLPSAGVGALLALMIYDTDLSVIALIGIILLIGIVKKNAILMIDFALAAERDAGQELRGGDFSGLPVALPADHDDDDGGDARRPAAGFGVWHGLGACGARSASAIVGGLIMSQMLTLFTHSGGLSLSGPASTMGRRATKAWGPGRTRGAANLVSR